MMLFGKKKKKLEQQLAELADQKTQQDQERRWNELQLQKQIREQEERQRTQDRELELGRQQLQRIENEASERERAWQLERQQHEQREHEAREREKQRRENEKRRKERLKQTTPEALRELRDLIRKRYQLDMEIYGYKGARRPDRPLVLDKMERADSVMMEIYNIVGTWEENERMWSPEEWKLAQRIKALIFKEGKRVWENNPPWNDD